MRKSYIFIFFMFSVAPALLKSSSVLSVSEIESFITILIVIVPYALFIVQQTITYNSKLGGIFVVLLILIICNLLSISIYIYFF